MTITISQAMDLARYSMILILQISAPMLVAGILVGLVISLAQAVTQLQDQTLSFAPKIIIMSVVGIVFLPWMVTKVIEFTQAMFAFRSTLG